MPLCSVLLLNVSPMQAGLGALIAGLPHIVLSLPAGVFLDRNRKLPILLASKAMQGLSLASIPLAWWLGILTIPWMYAVGFVGSLSAVMGGGAEQVFLTNLIGRDRLSDAQSKFAVTDSAARLVAPGIAGMLIQWLTAPFAVLVNASGFAASILMLRKLKANDPKPPRSDKHPLRDIQDGFRFIWSQPLLRTLALTSACWHMLFYGYAAIQLIFATRVLGMSAGMLGVAQTIGGIGVLLSSMLLKPLIKRRGPTGAMVIGIALTAFAFCAMPMIPAGLFGHPLASASACAALSLFMDCGVMLFLMPYSALRQKVTPDEYLGRMISTMRFLTVAIAPLGSMVTGHIGEHFGVRTGLACVGACSIVLTLWLACSSALRKT